MTELVNIVCPWYWMIQKLNDEKLNLYGDNNEPCSVMNSYNKLSRNQKLLLWLIIVVFWFYPMVKAFGCPFNGMMWGLLILLFPPLGLVFLIVGCPQYVMMPHQLIPQS